MKKVLSVLLAAAMLLSLITALPTSAGALWSGSWEYDELKDGTVEIKGYSSSGVSSLTIPSELNGKKVTALGNSAFAEFFYLTHIDIPASVKRIDPWAFWKCRSLTDLTVPDSVTAIGADMCHGCSDLASVTIPSSVKTINENAFYDCPSLNEVDIPSSVTEIGSSSMNGVPLSCIMLMRVMMISFICPSPI